MMRFPDTSLEECRIVRVIDGDTILVSCDGMRCRVRLVGLNSPESVAPEQERNCEEGELASSYLKKLLEPGASVWLQKDVSDEDEFGRLLRYVWLEAPARPDSVIEIEDKMVNAILIEAGYAQARRYEPDTSLWELFESLGKTAIQSLKGVSYKWAGHSG